MKRDQPRSGTIQRRRTEIESAAELFGGVGVARPEVQTAVRQLIEAFGEDVSRQGFEGTPERMARMHDELLAGYRVDPHAMINRLFSIASCTTSTGCSR